MTSNGLSDSLSTISPNGSPQTTPGARPDEISHAASDLASKLEKGTATIGVIGLGYVGLPLAVEYAGAEFKTIGIDLDQNRIRRLNEGDNYIDDLDDDDVRALVESERLSGETNFDRCAEIDVFFVCVPTPVTPSKDPGP